MKATEAQAERAHRFAHDLRNRLAAIQQVLQQFKLNGDSSTAPELIGFAEQQYFKAMRLTEEFLDDLQVERGVGELQRGDLDLALLARDSIAHMQHRFDRKRQQVKVDLVTPLMINGDPHWIKELITALLSNASKFTPHDGDIRVVLTTVNEQAVLEVSDSGVGLSSADLDLIFTRYAWLESLATDGEAQGRSTLGRAHQWAAVHGGELKASSPGPGMGSTFVLRLPLRSRT
jgi:signal transduction histidine kinase